MSSSGFKSTPRKKPFQIHILLPVDGLFIAYAFSFKHKYGSNNKLLIRNHRVTVPSRNCTQLIVYLVVAQGETVSEFFFN